MVKNIILLTFILFFISCNNKVEKPIYIAEKWENPEWENPEIFEINREYPTATFFIGIQTRQVPRKMIVGKTPRPTVH